MPKLSPPPLKWNIIFFTIAALIIALDQWTKWLVQTNMYPGQSIPETGFFRLIYAQNTGAAFSIFLGRNDVLAVFSILGVCLILFYNFYLTRRFAFLNTRFNKIAIALILGGTIGNLIDRVSIHHVRDFISVGPWPIFNVADSATVVGTIVFGISLLFLTRDPGAANPADKSGSGAPQSPPDAG